MIKSHCVIHLVSFEQSENIRPGMLVRHREVLNSIGIVISVEFISRLLYAQVLWVKYKFDIYENAINSTIMQIQTEEDMEILKIMNAASKVTT